ncbi:MAG: sulfatase [Sedimentisphaeraceae bacterium JB056]
MNRRNFLKMAGVSAAMLSLGSGELFAADEKRKPNIILIVADDMGYGDAGCYGDTNLVPTPNVDRLAKEGIRFTDGYVTAPVCGPCRYGMLTGAYQQRFGVQWNPDCWGRLPQSILNKLGIEEETQEHNRIPSGQKVISDPLETAGYATGLAGKWNLPCYPQTTFDETFSAVHFGADYFPNEDGKYKGVNETVPTSSSKDIVWGPKNEGDEYLTDRLGRQTVEFIEKHKDEPFFFYLGFNAPHSPMQAKKKYADRVSHLKTEALKLYGAMLISMDENVGKVLDKLDELGIADDTIVAFISDNGPTYAYNVDWPKDWPKELIGSAGPLSGHKGQFLEGGIRVPFIMRWPGNFKAGSVYNEPVIALDFYPTFCAAADAKVPRSTKLDGTNLLPYLRGEKSGSPHDILFWYCGVSGAVRKGKWKLRIYKDTGKLFDLDSDIAEKNDLSEKYPKIKAELDREYKEFCSQMPPALYSK